MLAFYMDGFGMNVMKAVEQLMILFQEKSDALISSGRPRVLKHSVPDFSKEDPPLLQRKEPTLNYQSTLHHKSRAIAVLLLFKDSPFSILAANQVSPKAPNEKYLTGSSVLPIPIEGAFSLITHKYLCPCSCEPYSQAHISINLLTRYLSRTAAVVSWYKTKLLPSRQTPSFFLLQETLSPLL